MSALAEGPAQYALTPEQLDLRDMIRALAAGEVAPRAAAIDAAGEFPQDLRATFAEHDLFALPFDERHGGTGTGALMVAVAIEEVAKACASSALMLAVQDLATLPIRLDGCAELQDGLLPRFASGEWLAAFALSEPDAGSDARALRTRARRTAGGWTLSGAKNWISNAGVADAYVVFAVSDPTVSPTKGMTAFLVEAQSPGFAVAKLEHKMGMRGSPTGQLTFDEVFVPDARGDRDGRRRLQGGDAHAGPLAAGHRRPGGGHRPGRHGLRGGLRPRAHAFGRPITELQGIQFKLADMETRTAAARELLYRAAAKVDAATPTWASTPPWPSCSPRTPRWR